MPFAPRVSPDRVRALLAEGGLTRWQVYALTHQHPLNQVSHFVGIPTILFGIAWPVWTWFAWGYVGWQVWLACQVIGWIFQFAGHWAEGNLPAFFGDPLQLAIGPVFFATKPYRWLAGRPDVDLDLPEVEVERPASAP